MDQHQCFAKLANGTVTETPVWLEPLFCDAKPALPAVMRDDLAEAAQALRDQDATAAQPSVPSFLVHMHRHGYELVLTPAIVAAAWQVCAPRLSRNTILARARGFRLEGVELLPSCWLAGLVRWLECHGELVPLVARVSVLTGMLWPKLHAPSRGWAGDGAAAIPEMINVWIYPSLWRQLKPQHLVRLLVERPDLREEAQPLPQVTAEVLY